MCRPRPGGHRASSGATLCSSCCRGNRRLMVQPTALPSLRSFLLFAQSVNTWFAGRKCSQSSTEANPDPPKEPGAHPEPSTPKVGPRTKRGSSAPGRQSEVLAQGSSEVGLPPGPGTDGPAGGAAPRASPSPTHRPQTCTLERDLEKARRGRRTV